MGTKRITLEILATEEEAYRLIASFDPRKPPPTLKLLELAPGAECKPGKPTAIRIELAGEMAPTETIAWSTRNLWVQDAGRKLTPEEMNVILDALYEAEWSCTEMRRRHEAAARQFYYAHYIKSAVAREACARDNEARAAAFDVLRTKLLDRWKDEDDGETKCE